MQTPVRAVGEDVVVLDPFTHGGGQAMFRG